MNIIFGRHNAEALGERFLVLELETLDANGTPLECFCVVDGNSIPAKELPTLDHFSRLHQTFVDNLKKKNSAVCQDLYEHLHGKFGGNLDSFYEFVLERVKR